MGVDGEHREHREHREHYPTVPHEGSSDSYTLGSVETFTTSTTFTVNGPAGHLPRPNESFAQTDAGGVRRDPAESIKTRRFSAFDRWAGHLTGSPNCCK